MTFILVILINLAIPLSIAEDDKADTKRIKGNDPDTIITIKGQVLDKTTLKPINASIHYKKLPFGSEYGIVNVKDSSCQYQICLFQSSSYLFKVKAPGYLTAIENVTPGEEDRLAKKNFYLISLKEGALLRLNHLLFNQGEHEILADSYDELNTIVDMMNEYPEMVIQLEGHTDFRGGDRMNMKLSKKRVKTVKQFLANQGIKKSRIKTKAFGGTQPITKKNTKKAKKMNRRVEVRILKM